MANTNKEQLKDQIRRNSPGNGANQRRSFRTTYYNVLDSVYDTTIATLTSVSESAIVSTTATIPANSFITEITAVATSDFSMDSGFYAVNIGTASLGTDGFAVANIKKGHHKQFGGTAFTEITAGSGASSNAVISQQLGSTITSSLQAANTFFTEETTLHLQFSSSGATTFFDTDTGVMKVAISYKQLI